VTTAAHATLIVTGAVHARGEGSVQILVDDRAVGTALPASTSSMPVAIVTTVGAGQHTIRARAMGGASVEAASLTVLITQADAPPVRRRATRR
jgi:hypothetical protein